MTRAMAEQKNLTYMPELLKIFGAFGLTLMQNVAII